jgi:hypothetical protein
VEPSSNIAGNMLGREDAIRSFLCVAPPIGCGRRLSLLEVQQWDGLTQQEYRQSGWCKACQDKFFKDPDEDPDRCTCNDEPCCSVDVGVGIIYCNHMEGICPQHDLNEEFHTRIYEHDMGYESDLHEV